MRNQERPGGSEVDVCLVAVELAVRYLRAVLRHYPSIRVLSEGEMSRKRKTPGARPTVFVVDLDSGHDSLSERLRHLRLSDPNAKVLLLAGELSTDELCGFLFLGIDGFVPYGEVADKMHLAIEALFRGHTWIEPQVLEEFVNYSRTADGPKVRRRSRDQAQPDGKEALTAREKLILGLLRRRFSNKEISSALDISENTVKFHISNIFEKLGVHDRYSVVELAVVPLLRQRFEPMQNTVR